MPLFLVGLCRLGIPSLVVADDFADVLHFGNPPATAKHCCAPLVQRSAHLLCCHLRIFPPEVFRYEWPQSPAQSTPGSNAASARCSPVPRSASSRPLACPDA